MQLNRGRSRFPTTSSLWTSWLSGEVLRQVALCSFTQQAIPLKGILTVEAAGDVSSDLCGFDPQVNNLEELFYTCAGGIVISLREPTEFLCIFICDLRCLLVGFVQ